MKNTTKISEYSKRVLRIKLGKNEQLNQVTVTLFFKKGARRYWLAADGSIITEEYIRDHKGIEDGYYAPFMVDHQNEKS